MALSARSGRRLLVTGVAVSLLAVGADAVAPSVTAPARDAAASVFTPVTSWLTVGDSARVRELTAQRDSARREAASLRDVPGLDAGLRSLLAAPGLAGATVVPARVVGIEARTLASTPPRLVLDVGRRDGIRTDQGVVAGSGLVGRVVTVRESSTVVEPISAAGAVVGARVQPSGALGSLSARTPGGLPGRAPGELTLTLVQGAGVRVGDRVDTLGSVDGRPYVAGIPVGTVVGLDPDRGQVGRTARVRPFVQLSSLDLVGVLIAPPARPPRAPVTAPPASTTQPSPSSAPSSSPAATSSPSSPATASTSATSAVRMATAENTGTPQPTRGDGG